MTSWLKAVSLACAALAIALLFGACQRAQIGVTTAAVAARPASTAPTPSPSPTPAPLKLPLVTPRIVISKSKRQLELSAGGRVIRTYPVALGLSPSDDKEREGDMRTPEGEFYVCMKNARSQFYLSLGLSYPNAEDAARGLSAGLITQAAHDRIVRALRRKQKPPWDTALGGAIMLHGGGTTSDWTWGCVALADADIKELFDAIPLGTPVSIEH